MEWNKLEGGVGEARIIALAGRHKGEVFTVGAGGELLRITLPDGRRQHFGTFPGLTAIACHRVSAVVAVGAHGTIVIREGDQIDTHVVDREVSLKAVSADGAGAICVVGEYDERTGALFVRQAADSGWTSVRGNFSMPGLLAISPWKPDTHIVCGRRGFTAVWDHRSIQPLDSRTEHPLRSAAMSTTGRWWVGGGGWAADMPILIQGENGAARPLLSAPGRRVIIGIVEDASGTLWMAQNDTDGERWRGSIWRLEGSTVNPVLELGDEQVLGITLVQDRLIAHDASGSILWSDLSA